ncbi:MAG: FTR1 family protein [Gaiellales bacterium]
MGSGLVVLREGFEASLAVGIVLAFLDRSGRRDGFGAVWAGVIAAVALSALAGTVLFVVGAELEGKAEAIFEGVTMVLAAGLLTWMVFWMRKQSRTIRQSLEGKVTTALASGSALGLAAVAFIGVLREGVETALFLYSTTEKSSPVVSLVSSLAGLVLALGLGYLFYRGSHRLDLRRFFQVTSGLLLLFAGWLLAGGIEELAEGGVIPENEALLWGAFIALAAPTLWFFFRKPRATTATA